MVIWVGVMPGADAVSAAFELPEPDPDPEPELEPPPEEQAATARLATVTIAAVPLTCQRSRRVRFMQSLPSHGGWPALRRPAACRGERSRHGKSGSPAQGR